MLEISKQLMALRDALCCLKTARIRLANAVTKTEDSDTCLEPCWIDHFIDSDEKHD